MALDYSAPNIFTAVIDEQGIIWEMGTGRKRQAVGIDTEKEQEYLKTIADMQDTLDSYYNKLIELGVIVLPKTPEQIALEQAQLQAEINTKLLEAISGLQAEIKELKTDGNHRCGAATGNNSIGQAGKVSRQVTAGSQKGDGKGAAALAGDSEQQ